MARERILILQKEAQRILNGEGDPYDGADAARIIDELCNNLRDMLDMAQPELTS